MIRCCTTSQTLCAFLQGLADGSQPAYGPAACSAYDEVTACPGCCLVCFSSPDQLYFIARWYQCAACLIAKSFCHVQAAYRAEAFAEAVQTQRHCAGLPLGALRLQDRQLKRQAPLVSGTDSIHQPRMHRQAAPHRHQTVLQRCQQIGSEQTASAHPSVAAARRQQRRCTTPKRSSCGCCSAAKWCVLVPFSTCTVVFLRLIPAGWAAH